MTLKRFARWLTLGLAAGAAYIGFLAPAQAIPVFARQTGHNCQACHISYPELTAYGREFKLNGYTFGEAQPVPLAFALMAEYGKPADNTDHSTGGQLCSAVGASCSPGQFVQWSLFGGGRISENLGAFVQYSSGAWIVDSNSGGITGAQDNTEFRYVHRYSTGVSTLEDDSVVGINVNNNMTMQDVWNTVPAWRFPGWFPYNTISFSPKAAPAIDGIFAHRAVGIGVYSWVRKTWYAELNLYRKPWGPFSWMVNGVDNGTSTSVTAPSDVMDGYSPYYRFAYSKDWGYNSLEVGVFGLHAKTYYDALQRDATQLQTFNDIAVDMQYQYNRNEPWIFSGTVTYERERSNNPSAMLVAGQSTNPSDTINELNIKGTVYYDRTYGMSLGYNSVGGSSDPGLYGSGSAGGSLTGDPRSSFYQIEFSYLPLQDMRFLLNYTAYTKLNGGTSNFDGFNNNAKGQNVLAAAIWWVF